MKLRDLQEAWMPGEPNPHPELDQKWHGEPMTEPLVLFRSVSIPELIDIAKTGKITGRQNSFNEFDPRKYVFFGDHISDTLKWQGEDVQRLAQTMLDNDPIHDRWKELDQQLEATKALMVEHKAKELAMVNRHRARASQPPLDSLPHFMIPREFVTKRHKIEDAQQKLGKRYREKIKALTQKLNAKPMAFTSAIIETRPMMGGVYYFEKFSQEHHLHEYGFEPGEVTMTDITKIHLLKKREIVEEITPDRLLTVIKGLTKRVKRSEPDA